MRVLLLDPYHTGSHRAFATGWRDHSAHTIDLLDLPGHHWKWRMRHAAWTLARRAADAGHADGDYQAVVATDMLDVAAWRGLAPARLSRLPTVVYFHESQLDYPAPHHDAPSASHVPDSDSDLRPRAERLAPHALCLDPPLGPRAKRLAPHTLCLDPPLGPRAERDLHFAFTNLYSAAAADAVWFNSAYHRDRFLAGFAGLLARMPDHAPTDALERIARRSRVAYPGYALLEDSAPIGNRAPGRPCHVLWAARWEQDKGAERWFAALDALADRGVDFVVSVIGGDAADPSPLFARARARLGERIVAWGWQAGRAAYEDVLRRADIVVSTAHHEFFGIAMVEAVAAGAFPLLPQRLAYPEVFAGMTGGSEDDGDDDGSYDGTVEHLTARLAELCDRFAAGDLWCGDRDRGRRAVARYHWRSVAPALDGWLEAVCSESDFHSRIPIG